MLPRRAFFRAVVAKANVCNGSKADISGRLHADATRSFLARYSANSAAPTELTNNDSCGRLTFNPGGLAALLTGVRSGPFGNFPLARNERLSTAG